jgi:hypothetical protein
MLLHRLVFQSNIPWALTVFGSCNCHCSLLNAHVEIVFFYQMLQASGLGATNLLLLLPLPPLLLLTVSEFSTFDILDYSKCLSCHLCQSTFLFKNFCKEINFGKNINFCKNINFGKKNQLLQ